MEWISEHLDGVDERASLAGLIGCGVACLQDRNQDVRHASEVGISFLLFWLLFPIINDPIFSFLDLLHESYEKRRIGRF